ncbi:polysaccharide biosynthesis tyrosine autokinase [Arenibacter sp. GZD96]|uniref:GumC family protein n=1 Tax=Aurantibrevibacter litoralis TaxID=3106030 RepID=UPI002B0029D5|nr:polysaccharide biosynthesis tyrosine autokinase [Arenibacter sp. GZD-96]MEA1787626.1 polysaccharide biosynthesis tyrosine autokinase [Arenibacter sp. GZD-96]
MHKSKNDSFELKEIIEGYTKHWKWFLISILVFVALAFLFIRYSTPEYQVEAKIQIVNDQSSGSGLDLFKELNAFSGGSNMEVEDEIELLNSRSNFIDIVKELGLNTRIIVKGTIRDSELYTNPPIKLNLISHDSIINKADFEFYVRLSSATTFGYAEEQNVPEKVYAFGKNIPTPIGDIVITPNMISFENYLEKEIKVVINPVHLVAQSYRNSVIVSASNPNSNILYLALQDPIKERAQDIINALITVYNRKAIEDKQIIADRTSTFINERINDISSSLSNVDQTAEDFKSGRGLTDIASEANINLTVGANNQQNLANLRTQYNIAASMKDIVEQQESFDVLPSNIGLSDPTIASATSKYNELVMERKRLLESSNEKNPVIVNLDQQISGIKRSMQSSLNSTVNNLALEVNNLSGQQAIINSKIYSAPRNERGLRDITRKQETTESLYLYLLQKREEAQIAVASTAPKSKVVDYAYNSSEFPISPRKNLVYLASMILGLLVPFSIIYIKSLLDNKIHNMHSLERITNHVPVLGELPRLSKKDQKMVVKDDRSVLAESLRILRTNLDYVIKSKSTLKNRGKNNIIYITSSVPGEGKTFLSSNLSMVLASTNKKVLLVGADIRNPKLYSFFTGDDIDKLSRSNKNKDKGLTEFLYDEDVALKDIINPMLVHHNTIDVIYSGRIPPNPAELLMSSRLKKLLNEVSEVYDYVIVDTAPMMVVSDTLLISEYADHLIYVTRAGFTDIKAVEFPLKLQEEGKIKGLAFMVNDVDVANLGYGGKYGYGYGKSLKKWWKF